METIKITIFQAYLFWENVEKNLNNLELRLSSLREKTDLILLPEMFNTGFTNNVEKCAETMDGPTMHWLYEMSKKFDCVVAGSLIIQEEGKYYNRFVWMSPNGSFVKYDKRHLFGMAGEDQYFEPGNQRVILQLKGWKICPMICYDLRFPVWSRNQNEAYDLLVYIASWPDKRSGHWRSLIPARAIENQAFVIGVNRVGYDGNEIYYSGGSMCISPMGDVVYYKPEDEDLYTFTLNPKDLITARAEFPFLKDGDDFLLK
ncbi:hydrolase, carbon-nitrogen family [Sphingobacterium spiritivorum ATCC 33300]|uniref:Omega-amidase YafV n=3 Tax=Sphingobacterium spiritivorum TaxID=258 RepID=D7VJD4_SPHSI|nr:MULTISPECIES: amidohydrolase [Sphingobacterium]EEI92650.1 hydrolase, carbon-nitrogen family [Sphingobacterium spiritivorum ATCC 33300]EFK58987.1 hydrolase, carbon-nitrogen family [Sphingobacterium spiritivorum ATCC 33861]QQS94161.1 amidohydrolase [Sphingobacterium spiritivorum]QQT27097.1 amidohydrolase [Sphingobacterium spiritivorum]QQT36847.1 amidohydrolase [Sphingobacterium spiritivorum]